jgi:hypothetical protein
MAVQEASRDLTCKKDTLKYNIEYEPVFYNILNEQQFPKGVPCI